jgi:cephalosporin hydroxylase
MDAIKKFREERTQCIESLEKDSNFSALSDSWTKEACDRNYQYNFDWLGRPIIQFPSDIVAMQELIWSVKPDLIIETGIAHGGSLIFSASMMALLDIKSGTYEPQKRKVVGIDIDIREHNRRVIETHPMFYLIDMIEGSSIEPSVIKQVIKIASEHRSVMVFLDSMHTHDHVFSELNAYAPLVSKDSYCVVFDTVVERFPKGYYPDRPWDIGNNPQSAVDSWMEGRDDFIVDTSISSKLQVTSNPGGYIKRIV